MNTSMQQGETARPWPRLNVSLDGKSAAVVVRGTVKSQFRNIGYSFGLDYPIVYGELPAIGWCCWNRHTGAIVYLPTRPNRHMHNYECRKWSLPNGYNGTNNFEYDSIA